MTKEENRSQIHISKRLRKVLERIYTESWIAKKLLTGIEPEILVEDHINYIDISHSDPTKISYLTNKKLDQAIKSFTEKHYGNGTKKVLSLNHIPMDLIFKAKGRVKIKFGSFVHKLLKDVEPKDVEKFSSLMKSIMLQPNYQMKIVEGSDIPKYYHQSYHASDRGSLGISCMRHDHCRRYFELYKNNPNFVKMLIMFDRDGMVMARALLWTLGKDNGLDDEFKYMDRIYTTKDDQTHYFIDWAKENGYAYKEKQSWNTPYRFQFKDDKFEKKMKIRLPNWNYAQENGGYGMPYLDTFKWVNLKDGAMYNYKPSDEVDKRNIYTPVSTNGEVYGFNYLKEDTYHKEYWYEGEIKWVDYLQMEISERYLQYSNINDTYMLKSHSIIEKYIGDYIFNEEYERFNKRDVINKIIEKKKEEERIRLEKIKKTVMKTIPFFKIYSEAAISYLDGDSLSISTDYSEIDGYNESKIKKMKKNIFKSGVTSQPIWVDSGEYNTTRELFSSVDVEENQNPEGVQEDPNPNQLRDMDLPQEVIDRMVNEDGEIDVQVYRDYTNEMNRGLGYNYQRRNYTL